MKRRGKQDDGRKGEGDKCECSGEGAIRVALSRMVAAGEVAANDGEYRLIGPALLQRQARRARDAAHGRL